MADLTFTVEWAKTAWQMRVPAHASLAQLGALLQRKLADAGASADAAHMKLLHKGRALRLTDAGTSLYAAGIRNGARLKLLASSKEKVDAVAAARSPRAMPSFEHEESRAWARQAPPTSTAAPGPTLFSSFEVWDRPGLTPLPAEAAALLRRLAADPGIAGVMAKHGWRVGVLSEMPPAGKVGVSPVCLLGVNVNQGQEISLRLRTDDLRGFRRYDRIKETLIHELAHMVHAEHDVAFKELNSQLRREAEALDWKGRAAPSAAGEGAGAGGAPLLGADRPAAAAARAGGRVGGGAPAGGDARAAAAAAALRRAGGLASFPVDVPASPPASPLAPPAGEPAELTQPPKKGDTVMYRQRDGSYVEARVVGVDLSVAPPSFGIELPAADGGEAHYRETELSRLRAPPPPDPEDGGYRPHHDPHTEAKEEEVRRRWE